MNDEFPYSPFVFFIIRRSHGDAFPLWGFFSAFGRQAASGAVAIAARAVHEGPLRLLAVCVRGRSDRHLPRVGEPSGVSGC